MVLLLAVPNPFVFMSFSLTLRVEFDFDPKKVELAKEYGAKAFTLGSGVDPVQFALEETAGHGVDAVLITASTTSNWDSNFHHRGSVGSLHRGHSPSSGCNRF